MRQRKKKRHNRFVNLKIHVRNCMISLQTLGVSVAEANKEYWRIERSLSSIGLIGASNDMRKLFISCSEELEDINGTLSSHDDCSDPDEDPDCEPVPFPPPVLPPPE